MSPTMINRNKFLSLVLISLFLLSTSLAGCVTHYSNRKASYINNFTHSVLCELGSATSCPYCSITSAILYKIYKSSKYRFYYVTLIADKNNKARNRLLGDYNLYGFPTCFFDGGYEIISGGYSNIKYYEDKIVSSGERNVTNITIVLYARWTNKEMENLSCEITIFNNQYQEYNGFLKVYLVEIISRWRDYYGNPYHFGFIDFIANTNLSIPPKEKINLFYEWNPAESKYNDVDPSNLMAVGVLFNSQAHQSYSDPPYNTKQFTAYYVDDAVGVKISDTSKS